MTPTTAQAIVAFLLAGAAAAGCSSNATAPSRSSAAITATPAAAAPATGEEPVSVTIKLEVNSVGGDHGSYIVNLHNGQPAKQTTFKADGNGKWSKTITVPHASFVKLDIGRIGATCTIALADTGQVLVTDENSCIVGS